MFDYIEIRLTCEEQGCMLCVKKYSHAQWRDFKMNVLVCDDERQKMCIRDRWNKSQHISEAEAKPGDLVFFEGTYDTPGKSHVGIYLGNEMMVSAGDPIKYANIHSSNWQK